MYEKVELYLLFSYIFFSLHKFGFYPHVLQFFTKLLGVLETIKMIT